MPVTELECQNCGAKLEAQPRQVMVKCKYCQTSSHVDWQQLEKPRSQPPVIVVSNGMTARGQKHLALFIVLSAIVPLGIGIVMFVVSMATDSVVSSSSTGLGSFGGTSPSAPASPEAPPPPPLTPEQARASALEVKMTAYVGACLNRLADRALASRARYRSWVPDETGPTPRSRYKYGLYALTNTSDCIQAIESSHAVEPAIEPLDGAAADFARELGTLATIVNEANRYYDRTEYEDDDMAHGAEMHRPLLEAFDRFVAASTALEVAVDPIFDEMMTQRTLSLSESDATNRLRYDSMRIAFEIAAMGNVHWRNLNEIDLETFEAKVSGFERMVATLRDARGEEAESLGSYAGAADKLALVAKQLVRRVRNHGGWSTGERMLLSGGAGSHWMVDGSPGAMINAYDELADTGTSPPLRHIRPVALMTDGY